jgi:hypothetical protein
MFFKLAVESLIIKFVQEEYAWTYLVNITRQFPGEVTLVAIGNKKTGLKLP